MKKEKMNWWKVNPLPYGILSMRERDATLDRFAALVANAEGEIDLLSFPLWMKIDLEGGGSYTAFVPKFFVRAPEDLNVEAFMPASLSEPPKVLPEMKRERAYYVELEDGRVATTWMLAKAPEILPEAFLLEFFSIASRIWIHAKVMPSLKAVRMLDRLRRKYYAYANIRGGVEDSMILKKIEGIVANLGHTHLLEFWIAFTVIADDLKSLREISKELTTAAGMRMIYLTRPPFIQGDLYQLRVLSQIPTFVIDSDSFKVFYPFISDNFADPEGIFIGENADTKQTILYDVYARDNYNVVILGETGSGKSMTAKVYIRRMLKNRPGMECYVIDPEGEYAPVAHALGTGFETIVVDTREKLGLDPLKMKERGYIDSLAVAEILADVYGLEKREFGELKIACNEATNIRELVEMLSGEAKEKMKAALALPDINIYEGEPVDFGRRVIFDLHNVSRAYTKALISSLIAGLLTPRLLLGEGAKMLVVDEGWLFKDHPAIMGFFNNIARRGRKRGVNFVFISQRPSDVASTEEGRTILEQSATVFLFRQNETAVDTLKSLYHLSDEEVDRLLSASPGEGILRAENAKSPLRVIVSDLELRIFSTKVVSRWKIQGGRTGQILLRSCLLRKKKEKILTPRRRK